MAGFMTGKTRFAPFWAPLRQCRILGHGLCGSQRGRERSRERERLEESKGRYLGISVFGGSEQRGAGSKAKTRTNIA